MARSAPSLIGDDLVSAVTTATPYRKAAVDVHAVRPGPAGAPFSDTPMKVAAFDFGLKRNMLELLLRSGCDVEVLPARTAAGDVLGRDFDGVFLSNGPGDPEPLGYAVATARELLGKLPIFGICLGHQVLARALGAETFKLPFGHRGANHPVRRMASGTVEITCQNHGFAVSEPSLRGTEAHLTHVNLNDRTVEGIEVPSTAFSVQYHPEAAPGPHDSRYLFAAFRRLMATFEPHEVQLEVPGLE